MAKKPESVFRERVTPHILAIPHSWFESISQKSIVGTPDMIGCINGIFVAIEFKASAKSKRGGLQIYKSKRIRERAKGVHFFVYPENFDEVYAKLLKISQLDLKTSYFDAELL